MQLPFTRFEFFDVFGQYNQAVWPMQIVLLALAGVVVLCIAFRGRWSGAVISAVLAFLWGWSGVVYHLLFFFDINMMAAGFALVFVAGAGAFLWFGTIRMQLVFGGVDLWRAITGSLLIAFSLAVYPVWSYQAGHPYPWLPTFGLPCPTTIFTVGVLAFMERPYPKSVLLVPIFWSLAGSYAAFALDVWQDLGLLASAAVGIALLVGSSAPRPDVHA